jgi:hypothetical protein
MASRKEQKEQLRKERQEREALAKAAERRRRLIGYGAGGALVAVVAIVLVVLLAGGGGGGDNGGGGGDALPSGGEAPAQKVTDLEEAAKAAGCELKSFRGTSREHTSDLAEAISYESNPPTTGKHFDEPEQDGAFGVAPDVKKLVHTLEHGRVIVWFKKTLPKDQRADLKALFDEDPYQMVLTPNETRMTYAVAASAWTADPKPNGTGRLLGCSRFTAQVFDALRTFKDEHRSNGPEPVP